jgi:putative sterol carrier protein
VVNEALIEAARGFFVRGFDGVVRVELTDTGGAFWVDGRGEAAEVGEAAPLGVERGFCLWQASSDTLGRLFTKERRRLESTFISGRLRISGDMSVMARLEPGDDA